jgi:hypothetical protein
LYGFETRYFGDFAKGNLNKDEMTSGQDFFKTDLFQNKTDITKNDGVRFDPTKGFIVKASGQDPSGTYTCQVGPEEDEDMLDFEVTLDQGEKKGEFEEFIQGSATFSYNATARQFVCCSDSSSDKPPKVGHYYCGHPTSCLLQKHALYKVHFFVEKMMIF